MNKTSAYTIYKYYNDENCKHKQGVSSITKPIVANQTWFRPSWTKKPAESNFPISIDLLGANSKKLSNKCYLRQQTYTHSLTFSIKNASNKYIYRHNRTIESKAIGIAEIIIQQMLKWNLNF